MALLSSIGMGTLVIAYFKDYLTVFWNEFNFPYYNYLLIIELPGIWFPFKDELCLDFIETEFGQGPLCKPKFEYTTVLFKTAFYYSFQEHLREVEEQKVLERATGVFEWNEPEKKTSLLDLFFGGGGDENQN